MSAKNRDGGWFGRILILISGYAVLYSFWYVKGWVTIFTGKEPTLGQNVSDCESFSPRIEQPQFESHIERESDLLEDIRNVLSSFYRSTGNYYEIEEFYKLMKHDNMNLSPYYIVPNIHDFGCETKKSVKQSSDFQGLSMCSPKDGFGLLWRCEENVDCQSGYCENGLCSENGTVIEKEIFVNGSFQAVDSFGRFFKGMAPISFLSQVGKEFPSEFGVSFDIKAVDHRSSGVLQPESSYILIFSYTSRFMYDLTSTYHDNLLISPNDSRNMYFLSITSANSGVPKLSDVTGEFKSKYGRTVDERQIRSVWLEKSGKQFKIDVRKSYDPMKKFLTQIVLDDLHHKVSEVSLDDFKLNLYFNCWKRKFVEEFFDCVTSVRETLKLKGEFQFYDETRGEFCKGNLVENNAFKSFDPGFGVCCPSSGCPCYYPCWKDDVCESRYCKKGVCLPPEKEPHTNEKFDVLRKLEELENVLETERDRAEEEEETIGKGKEIVELEFLNREKSSRKSTDENRRVVYVYEVAEEVGWVVFMVLCPLLSFYYSYIIFFQIKQIR